MIVRFLVTIVSLCYLRVATSAMDPNEIVGDCSKIQQLLNLDNLSPIQIGFTSKLDNDVGPNGYLKVELVYAGQAWLALGFSNTGGMVGGYSVVGIPGSTPPVQVYSMMGKAPSYVNPVGSTLQTLRNASVTQNATHTVLAFSKRLQESPEVSINGEGSNNFLVAWGPSNTFGYHGYANRFSFSFDLKYCVNGQSTAPPSGSPTLTSSSPSGTPAIQSIPRTSSPPSGTPTVHPIWGTNSTPSETTIVQSISGASSSPSGTATVQSFSVTSSSPRHNRINHATAATTLLLGCIFLAGALT